MNYCDFKFYGLIILLTVLIEIPAYGQKYDYDDFRENMVEMQIKYRGVRHDATLEAMRKVERHQFVPLDMQRVAYEDHPLPIGYGQTISQPYIVAFMTEALDPKPDHKVLEIGTGSGYQAAVLAEIVDTVYTIEIVEELYHHSTSLFESLGYQNIRTKFGDGYQGWEEFGPYDGIIVTAAPENIPQPLITQLKPGGKMIIPVGSQRSVQKLLLVEKLENGKITKSNLLPVRFVPMTRE